MAAVVGEPHGPHVLFSISSISIKQIDMAHRVHTWFAMLIILVTTLKLIP